MTFNGSVFKILKPYVYSVPLGLKGNIGVPLGIAVAPSERQEVFAILANLLTEKGFSQRIVLIASAQ
jgi:hypothetical protein